MSKTTNFRTQHKELLQIATEMSSHLKESELANDANCVRSLLSKLAGKLTVHLAMEDKNLYPSLLNHEDERVRTTAKRFIDEMGGIQEAFSKYVRNWPTSAHIQKNPSGFISETKAIANALSQRIAKEDNELYNMIDSLG